MQCEERPLSTAPMRSILNRRHKKAAGALALVSGVERAAVLALFSTVPKQLYGSELMTKTFRRTLFGGVFLNAGLLSFCAAAGDQRLDGIWVGTEKLSVISPRTDCPKPEHESLPAKIAVAQGGSLLAVVDGYGPGRYTNLHWSGDALVFEISNKRKGELRLSPDGKTLIEKGYVRRTIAVALGVGGRSAGGREGALSGTPPPKVTASTACLDELAGTFHREK
jgi:hypothetical protein